MKLARVMALAQKEWRELVRDRIYLALAFVMPTLLMIVFGYGISQDVRNLALYVVNHDHTSASRAYAERFAHTEHFAFQGLAGSDREAADLLLHERAHVVVTIPPRFGEDLASGRSVQVQTLIDGSFTSTRPARTVEGYITAINAAANLELQAGYLVHRLGISPERARVLLQPVELDVRYLYNAELRSIWSIAPSLIVFVVIFAAPMLMALSVVREKESGSIFNVYASTLSRGEFLAGKLLPNVLITTINAAILWWLAVVLFAAPFKGSHACFALGTLLYVASTTGFGLLVSLVVRTQAAALIIVGVSASILGMQYSGIFMPVASLEGFPWALAHAFPPMYYLEIVQGTFLKGLGFAGLWRELLVLVAFSVGYVIVAYGLFHKRVAE